MNIMSEFMGLIYGRYDAKPEGFVPGGMSLHNCDAAAWPGRAGFRAAPPRPILSPVKLDDTLGFHVRDAISASI